jgi:hypothetical protein
MASLPRRGGEGDRPKGGGGVAAQVCAAARLILRTGANYPPTMLRTVPLPIFDGEANYLTTPLPARTPRVTRSDALAVIAAI